MACFRYTHKLIGLDWIGLDSLPKPNLVEFQSPFYFWMHLVLLVSGLVFVKEIVDSYGFIIHFYDLLDASKFVNCCLSRNVADVGLYFDVEKVLFDYVDTPAIRAMGGLFVPCMIRTMVISYLGHFVRWTVRATDVSYHGLFVPYSVRHKVKLTWFRRTQAIASMSGIMTKCCIRI